MLLKYQVIWHYGAGNLASTYYERGQLDLAILHYKQAIACDQRFLEAYNNLVGFLNFCQSKNIIVSFYAFAFTVVANLTMLLTIDSKGNALKDVGRVDEAIQCYNVGSFLVI